MCIFGRADIKSVNKPEYYDPTPKSPDTLEKICINKIVDNYPFFKGSLYKLPIDLKKEIQAKANDPEISSYHLK